MTKQVKGKQYLTLYISNNVANRLRREMKAKNMSMSEIADQRLLFSYLEKFTPKKAQKLKKKMPVLRRKNGISDKRKTYH